MAHEVIKICPNWVRHVFDMRGIPTIDGLAIKMAIETMGEAAKIEFFMAITKLENGSEHTGTVAWVRKSLGDFRDIEIEMLPVAKKTTYGTLLPGKKGASTAYQSKILNAIGLGCEMRLELKSPTELGFQPLSLRAVQRPSKVSWDDSIKFEITKTDAPLIACALMGLLHNPLKLLCHRRGGVVQLQIYDEAGATCVRVARGNTVFAVHLNSNSILEWSSLVLASTQTTLGLGASLQMQMLRRHAALENAKGDKSKSYAGEIGQIDLGASASASKSIRSKPNLATSMA